MFLLSKRKLLLKVWSPVIPASAIKNWRVLLPKLKQTEYTHFSSVILQSSFPTTFEQQTAEISVISCSDNSHTIIWQKEVSSLIGIQYSSPIVLKNKPTIMLLSPRSSQCKTSNQLLATGNADYHLDKGKKINGVTRTDWPSMAMPTVTRPLTKYNLMLKTFNGILLFFFTSSPFRSNNISAPAVTTYHNKKFPKNPDFQTFSHS